MHDVWDRGTRPVIADAIARAGDGCDWLYLSVDIDVLDPGFAPGTGTPEPGGMNPADLLARGRRIAGSVELARDGRRRGVAALRPFRHHGRGRTSLRPRGHQRARGQEARRRTGAP